MKVDKTTVCRHAKEGKVGISYKSAYKRPYLTKDMKSKRVQFCKAHRARDWKKVVFSDSKIWVYDFLNSKSEQKVWAKKHERPVRECIKKK